MALTMDNKYKFSYGHLIPDELVNKILIMRESHPLAKIIYKSLFYIAWENTIYNINGRGKSLFINNAKKCNSIASYHEYIKKMNKKYPEITHKLVFHHSTN